jgi:hypothetical protein
MESWTDVLLWMDGSWHDGQRVPQVSGTGTWNLNLRCLSGRGRGRDLSWCWESLKSLESLKALESGVAGVAGVARVVGYLIASFTDIQNFSFTHSLQTS